MKKTLLAATLAFAALFMTSCNQQKEQLAAAQQQNDSLMSVINAKDAEIDGLFTMLNEIEDNLSMISSKYSTVQELRRNSTEGSYNVKTAINDQMTSIDNIMAGNKKKISELSAKVASLNSKNEELQAYITRLEERAAQQEAQIAELLTELENNKVVIKGLNKNISDLAASNQEKDLYIAEQTANANKVYFVVGSYDELKEAGIVTKSGGFIGIGRKQGTVADMNTALFTEIDRTKVTTIAINKKKAQVISKHPTGSYEMVMDENDESVFAYLRILNPTQFWKQTHYLVITTK
ncbi:MAG: hypothetical protein K5650_03110 [Bacteroidales bacterium]|nr:hypothetical protein [Bacteroidales bacterium]